MNVSDVYALAMKLMGEESEDGTNEGYTDEYLDKAYGILTVLQAELLPSADQIITDSEDVLQVSDRVARMVLPYGLAAHLLMEEDQNRAAFFNARYDELKKKIPSSSIAITDVYNVTLRGD